MLANPRAPWQVAVPPYAKIMLLGVLGGALIFILFFSETTRPAATEEPRPEIVVAVPELDADLLAQAQDDSRLHRLVIEPEPLAHLLSKAIDVSPAAAQAMGMPSTPVPVAELRADRGTWRGRWIWYKGVLEELTGPREGHPVRGFSIYEAKVRMPDGGRVFGAFSLPPGDDIEKGGYVRLEGFLLKLRDTTYPEEISEAPMLVGRQLRKDYETWPPVLELDPSMLADIDDVDEFPGSKMWHDVEEDQDFPLWHLAAFARDTESQRTFAEWRRQPVLNAIETHDKIVEGKIARGTPMRILGTLRKRRGIVADPNPAGIEYWTVAYVQCPDYGAHIVPIWVPKKVFDIPLFTDLEVRGFYYRWWAYESIENNRLKVPLFVAADLDAYDLDIDEAMNALGIVIGSGIGLLMLVIVVAQWRGYRSSKRHEREMDARRRRRREREAAAANP